MVLCFAPGCRRVARIWKKGGLFWKSEKTANDLDPNFHCSWIRITRFVRKFRRNFSETSEIQTLFQPKNRWSPKKKGLHQNWDGFFGQKRTFKRFFSPKTGDLQKEKKRSSPKLRGIFRPEVDIQTLFQSNSRHLLHNFGTQFPLGGAVFNFSPKIGFKSTKNVRFCILYRPMGGSSPPPPPGYATARMQSYKRKK